jgi:Mitochondrial genome maintenance MGM101
MELTTSLDIVLDSDGLAYLPEIKYRRILNKAFGPGGWGLAPRSETNVGPKIVSREYALVCQGRYVPSSDPLVSSIATLSHSLTYPTIPQARSDCTW